MTQTPGLYAPLIPEDVRENVRNFRANACGTGLSCFASSPASRVSPVPASIPFRKEK